MLNNPTVEKLRGMKLKVMAQVFVDPALRDLSFEERLAIMVEKEWLQRKITELSDSSIRPLWP